MSQSLRPFAIVAQGDVVEASADQADAAGDAGGVDNYAGDGADIRRAGAGGECGGVRGRARGTGGGLLDRGRMDVRHGLWAGLTPPTGSPTWCFGWRESLPNGNFSIICRP